MPTLSILHRAIGPAGLLISGLALFYVMASLMPPISSADPVAHVRAVARAVERGEQQLPEARAIAMLKDLALIVEKQDSALQAARKGFNACAVLLILAGLFSIGDQIVQRRLETKERERAV